MKLFGRIHRCVIIFMSTMICSFPNLTITKCCHGSRQYPTAMNKIEIHTCLYYQCKNCLTWMCVFESNLLLQLMLSCRVFRIFMGFTGLPQFTHMDICIQELFLTTIQLTHLATTLASATLAILLLLKIHSTFLTGSDRKLMVNQSI